MNTQQGNQEQQGLALSDVARETHKYAGNKSATVRERLTDCMTELQGKQDEDFVDAIAHINAAIYKLNKIAEKRSQNKENKALADAKQEAVDAAAEAVAKETKV